MTNNTEEERVPPPNIIIFHPSLLSRTIYFIILITVFQTRSGCLICIVKITYVLFKSVRSNFHTILSNATIVTFISKVKQMNKNCMVNHM